MSEQKLIGLLQQKRGYFETILDLTEEEGGLSIADWITNLEQKRVLLSCIETIDQEISPFKDRFHSLSQSVTEELDKLRDTVQRILHLESSNLEQRKRQLDEC